MQSRLFLGDNLDFMRRLPSGSIDLIYADPPFFTQRRYDEFTDVWVGLPDYISWLGERLVEMWRLLKRTGTILVHLDWHASHYVKVEMDRLFGYSNFLDEIVWHYQTSSGSPKNRLHRNHDTILRYARNPECVKWHHPKSPWPEETLRKWQRDEGGRIYHAQHGKRFYIDPDGKLMDDVWDITFPSRSRERVGYSTQKPEALLERLIVSSTDPNDIVADFFVGSGTTVVVAQQLGRRWVACDISETAIKTTRGRLALI